MNEDINFTSEEPLTEDGRQCYLHVKEGDISRYVLLPGDPNRVLLFKKLWSSYSEVAYVREYRTVTGDYKGVPITATSTGIGDLATSVALEQLARAGADTFIRVGSCGSLQEDVPLGTLIINTGMIRDDGTTKAYIQPEYPALASWEIVMALIDSCEKLNKPYRVGIGASADAFYAGQSRPGFKGYWQSWWDNKISDLQKAGILNWEGEASTVMTLSSLYGLRGGFISTVVANRITHEWGYVGEEDACLVASEAVALLAKWDQIKKEKNIAFVTPHMFIKY
ncbi:MAG TPA: nucleoside phosphorylase [Anaerolineaceae bacterium]|mgnify:CR=1 FL=1|jgi:uridine phosphorylase|nr:nucleoside phosphorylase [Anaerolineaceae bacterium]HUM62393.1 nucleoside phosphorylase [Anaerolineaceae bacterium]